MGLVAFGAWGGSGVLSTRSPHRPMSVVGDLSSSVFLASVLSARCFGDCSGVGWQRSALSGRVCVCCVGCDCRASGALGTVMVSVVGRCW